MGTTEARELLEQMGKGSIVDEDYTNQCVSKWGPLLKGIETTTDNGWKLRTTAVLLENEAKHMTEDTLSTNATSFTKNVFPVLRRIYPSLIANELVSIQPMPGPTHGVAYYEKEYESRKGAKIPQGGISNNPTDMNYDGKVSENDTMVQNFATNYTDEFIDYDDLCTDTGTSTSSALTQGSSNCRIPNWSPIRANGTAGQRTFYVKVYYRMLDADAASADTDVVATMSDAGNLVDDTANTNTVGTFDTTTGNWSVNAAGSGGTDSPFTNNTVIYAQYFVNWELVGQTAGASMPSIAHRITLSSIQAKKRAFKARWTPESVEDMKALYGVNIESDLVAAFAQEIRSEIDQEIIQNLIALARYSTTFTYSATVPGEIESIRSLMTKVGAMAAQIHKGSGRFPANFMVVSPDVGSLLDQLSTHGDYASIEQTIKSPSYDNSMADYGVMRIGTLKNKYRVYQNPFQNAGQILVGLKGRSWFDAGYVHAPYIPLDLTPAFYSPDDQTIAQGARSRYANKMLRPEYYGVITVTGLPTITSS